MVHEYLLDVNILYTFLPVFKFFSPKKLVLFQIHSYFLFQFEFLFFLFLPLSLQNPQALFLLLIIFSLFFPYSPVGFRLIILWPVWFYTCLSSVFDLSFSKTIFLPSILSSQFFILFCSLFRLLF
jgi:hypothetical protein